MWFFVLLVDLQKLFHDGGLNFIANFVQLSEAKERMLVFQEQCSSDGCAKAFVVLYTVGSVYKFKLFIVAIQTGSFLKHLMYVQLVVLTLAYNCIKIFVGAAYK